MNLRECEGERGRGGVEEEGKKVSGDYSPGENSNW